MVDFDYFLEAPNFISQPPFAPKMKRQKKPSQIWDGFGVYSGIEIARSLRKDNRFDLGVPF